MTSVYDVPGSTLIKELAEELKKVDSIKAPEWAKFVKTGANREVQPSNGEWWYIRSASVLRKVRIYGPIGVPTLRKSYGGRKNQGYAPSSIARGSGSVIRSIVKQLETAGFVKKTDKGRITTPAGVSILDKIAGKIKNGRGNKEKKTARASAKASGGKSKGGAEAAAGAPKKVSAHGGSDSRGKKQAGKHKTGKA